MVKNSLTEWVEPKQVKIPFQKLRWDLNCEYGQLRQRDPQFVAARLASLKQHPLTGIWSASSGDLQVHCTQRLQFDVPSPFSVSILSLFLSLRSAERSCAVIPHFNAPDAPLCPPQQMSST